MNAGLMTSCRSEWGVPARQGRTYGLEIVATGYGHPSLVIDNDEFFARAEGDLPADRAALVAETQMTFRRWCAPGETTWTMARDAVNAALAADPGLRDEIDVVLVSSATTISVLHPGDLENPGISDLAPMVLQQIGRNDALGLDLKACGCTGFVRCLEVADALLANPNYRAALLVSTEQGSRMSTAASNRSSFVFISSDAAGAAVVRKRESPPAGHFGIVDYVNLVDADKRDWVGLGPDGQAMIMKGSRAGAAVLDLLLQVGRTIMGRNGLQPADVTWLLPIQTHAGVVEAARAGLGWPREKVLWFGGEGGFSGSASIPVCLAEQLERGVVKRGDTVLAISAGAGISAGAALFVA
ncbi:3-oxoacyl-[acyl-carrier-protein] synthase III C-terminal domain-containing protein [Pseudonocardia sp. GCM10023141]|uniref:3-oxoacyl-[acyl-carrier-protein] synthase III C-terminal domain-containing protein n=1 Tax=Pseudonocardia sp. GCM10023141 TaxID=3252653 RepID=UPI0036110BCD